jgi:hypothetical protein
MERKENRVDENKALQIAKELVRNSDSLIFDAVGILQVLEDAEIESFFTGKSVGEILNEESMQLTRILQHQENTREMLNGVGGISID